MVQLGAIAEYVYERPGDTLVNQPTKFDLVIDFHDLMRSVPTGGAEADVQSEPRQDDFPFD